MIFRRKKSSISLVPGAARSVSSGISPADLAGRTAGVDAPGLAVQNPHLFARWQAGGLRPSVITGAFDPQARGGRGALFASTQFVGPWVDEACGTREPAVDRWEQGLLYPTWEQLCKLVALTRTPLDTLLNSPDTPNLLNGCAQEPTAFALRQRFHPLVVDATVNAHPHQASPEDAAQALNEAMAAIHQAIQEETDPLTLFLNEALKETSPGKDNTSQP